MTRKPKRPSPLAGEGREGRRANTRADDHSRSSFPAARSFDRPPPRSLRDRPSPQGLSEHDIELARSFLIHEDAQTLAFNKPAGLAVQGGSGVTRSLELLLQAFAKSNGKMPRLVHRLDRETSGVIVAARTTPAAAFLSEAFASRDAKKTYLAIVCGGAPAPRDGEIALKLKKSSRKGLDIMEASPSGQDALTRYRTLTANDHAALVELAPETGRMHQLRAHLAAIGRPIAGDGKYGGLFQLGDVPTSTLMLHALALDIPHPAGGRLKLAVPPPPAFVEAAKALGFGTFLPPQT